MNDDIGNMSEKELDALLDELRGASGRYSAAYNEKTHRQSVAEGKKEASERAKLLGSAKVKKLAVLHKQAMDAIQAYEGKHELEIILPITFTFSTDVYKFQLHDFEDLDYESVFDDTDVTAKIGQVVGLNKLQKALLQRGLTQVVERACEEIYGLFPVQAEKQKVVAELNSIVEDLNEADLNIEDLEGLI